MSYPTIQTASQKEECMETIVHCRSCGEDTNRADWEAARKCCANCGESTGVVARGWDALALLRERMELELAWRPVTGHA
jgi:ribosomal protein L37E